MRVPNLRTAPKRQSLSNVLGQITILTKILKNVYPPRPLIHCWYAVTTNNGSCSYSDIDSSWEICLSMRQISLRERVEIA